MLLFILFLGYMLFNTREGFNVGGQVDVTKHLDQIEKNNQYRYINIKLAVDPNYCTNRGNKEDCQGTDDDFNSLCKWCTSNNQNHKNVCMHLKQDQTGFVCEPPPPPPSPPS